MEDRLKRRKLDALRRGVHRMPGGAGLPVSTHVVGIGRSGAAVIAEMLRGLEPGAPKLTALAIDVGDQDLAELRTLAQDIPAAQAEITVVALEQPAARTLHDGLRRYPDFLTLEYPRYAWGQTFEPWLPAGDAAHLDRARAKAVYGLAYYGGARPMHAALRRFARGIEAEPSQAVIAIVFGLGGATGSGIALDLARHLSTCIFGRRILVTGVGIMPCDGDQPGRRGAHLYPVLNELDCLGDEGKNQGVVASCGELFRNPFTAGFVMVPQQHAWEAIGDLAQTQQRTSEEVAAWLGGGRGVILWETLRLLNWVAAPSTQHSAARTPWGPKWIHMLVVVDQSGSPVGAVADMARAVGLLPNYAPEYVEIRVHDPESGAGEIAGVIGEAFHPDVPPQVVGGARLGTVQFILPCIAKTDLALFYEARDAYDLQDGAQKQSGHALLLDQSILLSEPSTRLEGMAGAGLPGSQSWIAVPLDDLRGGEPARPFRDRGRAIPAQWTGAPHHAA